MFRTATIFCFCVELPELLFICISFTVILPVSYRERGSARSKRCICIKLFQSPYAVLPLVLESLLCMYVSISSSIMHASCKLAQ